MTKRKCMQSVAVVVLVCMLLVSMAACAPVLRGTYSTEGVLKQSVTFKDNNEISLSAFGIDINGTYRIENDKIIITYSILNISTDWEKSFKKDGDSIFIDGTEFIKEK